MPPYYVARLRTILARFTPAAREGMRDSFRVIVCQPDVWAVNVALCMSEAHFQSAVRQ